MGIGRWSNSFPLTTTGLPAVGTVITVKNTGTNTLSALTDAAGTPTGGSTFAADGRGNGHFYADDGTGYDLYDSGTLLLTDERVVASGGVDVKPKSAVYFVDPTFGNDTNDGKSWGSAHATIAHAITVAGSSPADFYLAPGTHNAAVDTLALNVIGHSLHGPGRALCILNITGTGTYGLKIEQAQCLAEGFSVSVPSTVTYGAGVTVNPTSTEMTTFRDVLVQGGTNGFGIGADTSLDVAETSLFGCFAFNYSRAGYQIGNGTPGNVLNTRLYSCVAEHATGQGQYGIRVDGSGVEAYGVTLQDNSVADVFLGSNMGSQPIVIDGIRSENSARLWQSGFFSTGGSPMTLRNALYDGSVINVDGSWIQDHILGPLIIENATCVNAAHGPNIDVETSGPQKAVALRNVTQANPISSGILTIAGTKITIENYTDTTGGSTAVTPFAYLNSNTTEQVAISDTGVMALVENLILGDDISSGGVVLLRGAGALGAIQYTEGGTHYWHVYKNAGDSNLYIRDMANSRFHAWFTPGASNTAAISEFASRVKADGGLDVTTVGQGIAVAEGTNAKQGTAVLVAGTKTVANTSVTASSRIFLSRAVAGGTLGHLSVGTVTAGTSFVINSSSATDTSTINYEIFEPG